MMLKNIKHILAEGHTVLFLRKNTRKNKIFGWSGDEKRFYFLGLPLIKKKIVIDGDNTKTKIYFLGLKLAVKYQKGFKICINILGIKFNYKNRKDILFNQIQDYKRFDPNITLDEKIFYLTEKCKRNLHYTINLKRPQTFNEKMNWLKLYYHNPLMTVCADKYNIRTFVEKEIGSEYLIPLLGVWDNVNNIDFDKLPDQFVLKVNWGSGQNIICKNKKELDFAEVKQKLIKWMAAESNHYFLSFEWGYKNIKPLVVAEKYIEQIDGGINDYKFFCFNGKPQVLYVAINGHDQKLMRVNYYDMSFNLLPFIKHYQHIDHPIEKPRFFDKMVELSAKLSKDFPFVRVDFFDTGEQLFIGEMTFFPGAGWDAFEPAEWDRKLGDMLELPKMSKKQMVESK